MQCQKNFFIITYMKQIDEENLKKFANVVKRIRTAKSSSLNNIAFTRGGVTSATLSRIENAQVDFKFSTLLKLAFTLDVTLEELLKGFKYTPYNND